MKGAGPGLLLAFGKTKSKEKDDDDEDSSDDSKGSFGEAGAGMAVRAFIKAIGVDPDGVDVGKATKALRAAVKACSSGGDEDYDE